MQEVVVVLSQHNGCILPRNLSVTSRVASYFILTCFDMVGTTVNRNYNLKNLS